MVEAEKSGRAAFLPMAWLLAILAALSLASPATSAPSSDDRAYVHWQMRMAGFAPLEEMTFGGRDVRRVLLLDPYQMLPIPGLEFERHADGRLTLRTQHAGWTGQVFALTPEDWGRLAALEAAAYAPPPLAPVKTEQPAVVMHCWGAFLEASPDKATIWSGCVDKAIGGSAYVDAAISLAIEKMVCPASEKASLWRFVDCTRAPQPLDDPALEAAFAELRTAYEARHGQGADMLGRARAALRAARANRATELVATARQEVLAFGGYQEALRELIQTGFAPFRKAEIRSAANAAILGRTRRAWLDNLAAQDRNYIGLLEELARLDLP